MAYFARKLWYGAHDGDDSHVFAALLELRRRKNGKPIGFMLFEHRVFTSEYLGREPGTSEDRMIRFPQCSDAEEALDHYAPGRPGFPGWDSEDWERTTGWAYRVGAGGSYEYHRPGTWVKTTTPNPWRNHRRKSRGKVCDTSYQLRGLERELAHAEKELKKAESDIKLAQDNIRLYDCGSDEYELLDDAVARKQMLGPIVLELKAKVQLLTDEMRFAKAKALGVPYWPRQEDGTLKRAA